MSNARRAARNVRLKVIGEVFSRAISVAFNVYLVRQLGTAGYGTYALAYGTAATLAIGADLGLSSFVARDLGRKQFERVGIAGGIKLIAVGTVAFVTCALALTRHGDARSALVLAAFFLAGQLLLDHALAVFMGLENLAMEAWLKSAARAATSAAGFLALALGSGPVGVLAGVGAGSFGAAIAALLFTQRQLPAARPRFEFSASPKVLRESLPIALYAMLTAMSVAIDVPLYDWLGANAASQGLYGATAKLVELLLLVPAMASQGIYLVLLDVARTPGGLRGPITKSVRLFFVLTAPLAFGGATLAWRITSLVYGEHFVAAGDALCVGLAMLPLLALGPLAGVTFLARGEEWRAAQLRGVAFAVKVGAAAMLVPILGLRGLAASTPIGEFVFLAASAIYLRHEIDFRGVLFAAARPLAAGAICLAVVARAANLPLPIVIALGAVAYGGAAVAFGAVSRKDLQHSVATS